jgi:hypothetical protein
VDRRPRPRRRAGGRAGEQTHGRRGRGSRGSGGGGRRRRAAHQTGHLAGAAGADAEWCDAGSPPPNDFRLQPTGGGSVGSPPAWLRSTDDGEALLALYASLGLIDLSQVATLEGGVATGMGSALTGTSYAEASR